MAPPSSKRCSVSVVLPASGCEMIAKVRRLAASDLSASLMAAGDTGTGRTCHPGASGAMGVSEALPNDSLTFLCPSCLSRVGSGTHAYGYFQGHHSSRPAWRMARSATRLGTLEPGRAHCSWHSRRIHIAAAVADAPQLIQLKGRKRKPIAYCSWIATISPMLQ